MFNLKDQQMVSNLGKTSQNGIEPY